MGWKVAGIFRGRDHPMFQRAIVCGFLFLWAVQGWAEKIPVQTIDGGGAVAAGGNIALSGAIAGHGLPGNLSGASQSATTRLAVGYYPVLSVQLPNKKNAADPIWLEEMKEELQITNSKLQIDDDKQVLRGMEGNFSMRLHLCLSVFIRGLFDFDFKSEGQRRKTTRAQDGCATRYGSLLSAGWPPRRPGPSRPTGSITRDA